MEIGLKTGLGSAVQDGARARRSGRGVHRRPPRRAFSAVCRRSRADRSIFLFPAALVVFLAVCGRAGRSLSSAFSWRRRVRTRPQPVVEM